MYRVGFVLMSGFFASAALAVPIRPPQPIGPVPYKIVMRQAPADSETPKIEFTAKATDAGFVLHKLRGPETIEALLGTQQFGDFTAEIEVDIAGFGELGIRPNGGTPVPYFGFRGSSGKTEAYFLLSTYGGGWHSLSINIRRQGAVVSAMINNFAPSGLGRDCAEPGYITFVMNDTSKIRIRRLDIRPIGAAPAFPLAK